MKINRYRVSVEVTKRYMVWVDAPTADYAIPLAEAKVKRGAADVLMEESVRTLFARLVSSFWQ